ncbi:TetR/AcrR family transcriptional regulator [Neisseriaceae bacterium CLB008]|nr:TetR family transcriptional regulator [Neisseriaceae bacterium]
MDQHTITKLMHSAERLFATHGFTGTSLRQITREADVNVAAVHYHFGSKEALFLAVLNRRLLPFVEYSLARLDEVQAQSMLLPEHLVQAFVASCLHFVEAQQDEAVWFVKLLSRLMLDEYRVFRESLAHEYEDYVGRFLAAFSRALPNLPLPIVRWRMHLSLSTLFNAFAGNDVLKALTHREWVNAKVPSQVAQFVVPFVVAGLKAPA